MSTVSLVTVGILIGVSSLGYLFTNGFQRRIVLEILTGVVMTLIVALLLDRILAVGGKLLMPWASSTNPGGRKSIPVVPPTGNPTGGLASTSDLGSPA